MPLSDRARLRIAFLDFHEEWHSTYLMNFPHRLYPDLKFELRAEGGKVIVSIDNNRFAMHTELRIVYRRFGVNAAIVLQFGAQVGRMRWTQCSMPGGRGFTVLS
jgi:hypothetical protein